jgi:hypothetical protein
MSGVPVQDWVAFIKRCCAHRRSNERRPLTNHKDYDDIVVVLSWAFSTRPESGIAFAAYRGTLWTIAGICV